MRIQFQIHYTTHPGQHLVVSGPDPALGSGQVSQAPLMELTDLSQWLWSLEIEFEDPDDFSYRYYVNDSNYNTCIEEWGPNRQFKVENRKAFYFVLSDCWRPMADPEFALNTSAFLNAILKCGEVYPAPRVTRGMKKNSVIVRFNPMVIRIKPEHRVAIAGSTKSLGNWADNKALSLGNPDHPVWSGEVRIPISDFPVRYKYLIRNEIGQTHFWEKSSDRTLGLPKGEIPEVIEVGDEKFDFPQYPWKGAGVAIPVFSLRRRKGFGVGEFSDLKLLVDWAAEAGLKMVQVLPVNDTVAMHTWHDSYPYAAISVYALHPMYINLMETGKLTSDFNQQIIEAQGSYLNSLEKIDYEAVMKLKSRFFKLLYDQDKADFLRNPEFLEFFREQEHWLKPYAAFCYLRDLFNTPDFTRWGQYRQPDVQLMAALTDEKSDHYDEIAVHYFIQFHAYRQLLDAAGYARSKGVVLKGDIPIGIYRNSVDAWLSPQLYHMDCQAGAPPDDFSIKGQNWRFPTYNWDEMARDNYSWWQKRLHQLSGSFDAFRIDHILGFFRIWEIPADQVEGLMGYFNPSIPFYRDELQYRGLWFDEQRLCQPYIREHFLYDRFGDLTGFVKQHYLEEYSPGCYYVKAEYDTQSKVERKLTVEPDAGREARNRSERIIQGLNSLISEVIFLEAPGTGGDAFFPRNALHFTRSYQELDNHSQQVIDQVYLDYFYKRNEDFWREKAMRKLPVIKKATKMLLCGEDLGMVPACVPSVMNELGILSLEVQRMPKNPKMVFGHPADYPYLSVATPSSHDTSTIRGWWEEDSRRSQRFYNENLGNQGASPFECTAEIVRQIITQHLYSPSMWAIFPIQDLLGMDEKLRYPNPHAERINNPGNPNHYWRYRMHLNLEDLPGESEFNRQLRQLIGESGRLEVY
ncbi:MAG: 4-alpha-glucanotransferase [Bacteroidales bacterium]|jgi:4-alpha-glucanotransferase